MSLFAGDALGVSLIEEAGTIDLDQPVRWKNTAIFRAAHPKIHLYYILPTTIDHALLKEGKPDIRLSFSQQGTSTPTEASLSIGFRPVFDWDAISAALAVLRRRDPLAEIRVLAPEKLEYEILLDPLFIQSSPQISKASGHPSFLDPIHANVALSEYGMRLFFATWDGQWLGINASYVVKAVRGKSRSGQNQPLDFLFGGLLPNVNCKNNSAIAKNLFTGEQGCASYRWSQTGM